MTSSMEQESLSSLEKGKSQSSSQPQVNSSLTGATTNTQVEVNSGLVSEKVANESADLLSKEVKEEISQDNFANSQTSNEANQAPENSSQPLSQSSSQMASESVLERSAEKSSEKPLEKASEIASHQPEKKNLIKRLYD